MEGDAGMSHEDVRAKFEATIKVQKKHPDK
jgi:hypothetical protein